MNHDQTHRDTAAQWYDGQGSALYAYQSTGTIKPGLDREVLRCIASVEAGKVHDDLDRVGEHQRLLALLHHVEPKLAVERAGELGRDHGTSAAAWWEQEAIGGRASGDTAATALWVLQGIEDGDPAVLDSLPASLFRRGAVGGVLLGT